MFGTTYNQLINNDISFIKYIYDLKTKEIKSPSDNNRKFIPKFFYQYNNLNNLSSTIGQIYNEYYYSISLPIEKLKELKIQSEILGNTEVNNELLNTLEQYYLLFFQLDSIINNINDKIIDYIIKFDDLYKNTFIKISKLIFIMLIIFPSIIILSLIFFVFCNCQCIKIIIQFFWNLCFLLCFISLILGPLFGILSTISEESIPVISYLLSPNYMTLKDNLFGGNEEMSNLLNKCLNDDGDLYSEMKISKTKLYLIDNFLSISREINEQQVKLSYYTNFSQQIFLGKGFFQPVFNDPIITTDIETNTINDDYQSNLNILNECQGNYYFVFRTCESYETNCVRISDLDNNPIVSLNDECLTIYTKIANSYGELYKELYEIHNTYNLISLLYQTTFETIINTYTISNTNLTRTLVNIYEPLISENGKLENLFNCSYMKQDLIKFFGIFKYKFSKDLYQIYCCFISSSFLIIFSIIYALITLYDGIKNDKYYSKTIFEYSSNLKKQSIFDNNIRNQNNIIDPHFTYRSERNLNNEN